ncbi:hypothetical protein KNU02_gp18 [Gordonia phage Pleakley]|uniref:Uncharacterized protein n=1 Tax=Gordonia phage Pleakley TaxID=2283246 RepID=A0A345M6D6_9CAUD|nr:hypothetical protein KNU02_gp18 [Gordonia phage Pleakley]AXH49744.1 hypothetical protein SEA_FURY_18 [Gordonia phage Fury]AXH66057.1 hypothetical protein SEA_PLEAKLEY_18 [Gordonia phage Pleakley]
MKVGYRPSGGGESIGLPKRAVLVACDQPLCERALTFPVNLQSTDSQCIRDTIRFMEAHKGQDQVSGWIVDTTVSPTKFFCKHHAENPVLGTIILK